MTPDELFHFVQERFHVEPDHPWSKHPDFAVLRHQDTRKWFGLYMNVPATRLGFASNGEIDVLNVKVDPDDALVLQYAEGIFPAYHMNKKHWVSLLTEKLPNAVIEELLETSFRLTEGKK